jgi:uncharacterized membrane protein YGL010W
MFIGCTPLELLVSHYKHHEYAIAIAGIVFFIAWVGQFIGHFKYENAKPAFFEDIT